MGGGEGKKSARRPRLVGASDGPRDQGRSLGQILAKEANGDRMRLLEKAIIDPDLADEMEHVVRRPECRR